MAAPSPLHREEHTRIGGGYSRGQRIIETSAVIAFFAFEALLVWRLLGSEPFWWLAPVAASAAILGALLSDLISGLVHWACDSWGGVETPFFGRLFIRQFREHHFEPEEIARHDFVEANGTNAGLALLPLLVVWLLPFDARRPMVLALAFQVGGMSLAFFTTFTSQAHQWAHSPSPPRVARWLQRLGLVLSAEHHAVHHVAPHRHHYCITGGWMDRWLERGAIFRRLEASITRHTGAWPVGSEGEPESRRTRDAA